MCAHLYYYYNYTYPPLFLLYQLAYFQKQVVWQAALPIPNSYVVLL